ncbi:MAG: hypothetical protein LAE24_09560 [Candidatus Contendobacter sp.]|nr:hypothetical protein [Candidatus Contendobacter sp.]
MRKLITVVVVILLVVILMAGGVWGYLWYNTKQQVDQWVAMAKPFAEISYSGIDILPTGSIAVNRLRIAPNFVSDSITIGAIRINTKNILALLNVRRQISQGNLPEALGISFHQFELPLHGGILGGKPATPGAGGPFDNLEALGCGPILHLGGTEWQGMGYEQFISNIEIGYRLDLAHQVLNLQVDSQTRDWATLNLEIGFALTAPTTAIIELKGALTPKLANLNFVIRDDGFNARRNNYCAAKAGKPIPDYIADHVRLVVERLRANGIDPGPGLIDAYRRYLTESGEITITATPPAPINPAEIPAYTAANAIMLLGLKVKVNQTVIADPGVDWDAAKVARALGVSSAKQTPQEETVAVVEEPQKPAAIQKVYHSIPVGELGQHVGKMAKLRTSTGANYKGQLEVVAEGLLRIRISKSGGNATLSLRTNDITAAEVLY